MRGRIVTENEEVLGIARAAKRVAVLGIKTERQASEPAYYVPAYLKDAGLEIVPVPVYYPDIESILGIPAVRRVSDIAGELDIVDVFRRGEQVGEHLDDLLAKRPRCVWFQSGIKNDGVAEALAAAGIDVVQDRCLMVEHRKASRQARPPLS